MDTLTKRERSKRMSLIRSKDTKPEWVVRRLVHRLGHRYRLHVRSLPGCPDLVFPRKRKVIFVHGCFWHKHSCKLGNRMPKSHVIFWKAKLLANQVRDSAITKKLASEGWQSLTVWECETTPRRLERLTVKISAFLK